MRLSYRQQMVEAELQRAMAVDEGDDIKVDPNSNSLDKLADAARTEWANMRMNATADVFNERVRAWTRSDETIESFTQVRWRGDAWVE